jgi:hypothetical protein
MSTWFSATAVVPQLREEWDLSRGEASWLTIAVSIGFVVGALLSSVGNVADVLPPRLLSSAAPLPLRGPTLGNARGRHYRGLRGASLRQWTRWPRLACRGLRHVCVDDRRRRRGLAVRPRRAISVSTGGLRPAPGRAGATKRPARRRADLVARRRRDRLGPDRSSGLGAVFNSRHRARGPGLCGHGARPSACDRVRAHDSHDLARAVLGGRGRLGVGVRVPRSRPAIGIVAMLRLRRLEAS